MRKSQKVAKVKPKKVQKAAPEPKKRHRRTKAELLKDPAYRRKHGLDASKITDLKAVAESAERIRKAAKASGKKRTVVEIEVEYLRKMYDAWQKVQSLANDLERELNLRIQPAELMRFDFACSHMEQAFEKLEADIKNRKD